MQITITSKAKQSNTENDKEKDDVAKVIQKLDEDRKEEAEKADMLRQIKEIEIKEKRDSEKVLEQMIEISLNDKTDQGSDSNEKS